MSLFNGTENRIANLRPYQQQAVSDVLSKFQEHRKLLMVVPTGGGKTIIFSALAQKVAEGEFKRWDSSGESAPFKIPIPVAPRTLILAHRDELIDQAIDKLWHSTGIEAAKEKADDWADLNAPVVVGSVQTLMREKRRQRWPANHFGLVVVDEAHHALADSYQNVLAHFHDHACVLGVTATPDRGDKKNLGKYFEALAYEVTLLELIAQGYLSSVKTKTIPIRIDLSGVKIEKGDYDANDLDSHISRYLVEIAAAIRDHAPFRKVLIFLPLVKTSLAMRDACRSVGLAAEHIDGASDDRKEILERFARNEFDVLCNAMLLTEGYDCPDVDCVVVLRPTKVRSLYSQMVGRGTRIAPGKDYLLLLDFLWMHERHDLIKPAHLISKCDKTADVMQSIADKGGVFDLEELQKRAIGEIEKQAEAESEAKKQRESKMIESIKENAGKGKRFFDAMEFALSLHDEDLMNYEPEFGWESKEPTEKQLTYLARMGFDPGAITSRGLACRLSDRLFSRMKMNLATPKQLAYLRKFKVPDAEKKTFAEASAILDERFSKKPTFQRVG